MRVSVFILFMAMTMGVYAQKYKVGTTTALWKVPASTDFSQARSVGLEYVEVAFNQCYRGIPANEVIPRVRDMKAKIDSAGIKVWSIHLPFSRTLDISVLDEKKRKENVDFMAEMIEQCAQFQPKCLVLHPSSEPIDDSIRAQRIANASRSIAYLKKYADQIGAQLCIENLPRTCLGNTPEELWEIIKDIPDVKVCFDTNHYTKGTTEHFVETIGERIGTIHASDFDFVNECHWLPTQGDIKWGKLMHALEGVGYEGVFMYEATKDHENHDTRPTPEQVVETFNKIINDYKTLK